MRPLGATSTAATGFWSVRPWARTRARSRGSRSSRGAQRCATGVTQSATTPAARVSAGRKTRPRGRTRLGLVGQVAGAGRLRGNLLEKGAQLLRRHAVSLRGDGPAGVRS